MEAGGRYDASAIATTEISGAGALIGTAGTEVAGRIHRQVGAAAAAAEVDDK